MGHAGVESGRETDSQSPRSGAETRTDPVVLSACGSRLTSEAGKRDARPDELDDAEGPGAGEEPVGAREHAAGGEGEDESRSRFSSAYIVIMNVSATTP